jgi:lysophospholipase L1-like esterase
MTGRIALLGDSQAQGLSSPLRTLAVSAGWTVPPSDAWVTDAGATTRELIAQLPQIARLGAFDVLVVTAGGNDHRTSEGQRTIWRELVSRAKNAGIGRVVWLTPPRAMPGLTELDAERRRIADAIVETFAGDPRVTVIRGREMTDDLPQVRDVHFTPSGYRTWAERLVERLGAPASASSGGGATSSGGGATSSGGAGLLLLAAAAGLGAYFLARGSRGGMSGLGKIKLPSDATRELVSAAQAMKRIEKRAGGPVPLDKLPEHIRPYAEFMERSATRKPSARDIVKAYVITRSSVQRQAANVPTVCRYSPEISRLVREMEISGKGKIRPEDVMSRLLLSTEGKEFLDLVSKGQWGFEPAKAAFTLSSQTKCFGFSYDLLLDMRAAAKLAAKSEEIGTALRTLPPEAWVKYVQKNIPGVSGAKAGFIAALLGRGDVPTFDARELKLWRKDQQSGIDVKPVDVMALRKKIASWKMDLEPRHEPFRQHLVHHALWDAYPESGKGTETTHSEVVRAMELAGARRRR